MLLPLSLLAKDECDLFLAYLRCIMSLFTSCIDFM